MQKDPLAQYRQLSIESQVDQASPHHLIELLFNSAVNRLKQAQLALEAGDIAEKGRLLGRVQEIIATLRSSLNFPDTEDGVSSPAPQSDSLPAHLDALYDYCQRRLLQSHLDNDSEGLLETQQLLQTVQQAWGDIAPR